MVLGGKLHPQLHPHEGQCVPFPPIQMETRCQLELPKKPRPRTVPDTPTLFLFLLLVAYGNMQGSQEEAGSASVRSQHLVHICKQVHTAEVLDLGSKTSRPAVDLEVSFVAAAWGCVG